MVNRPNNGEELGGSSSSRHARRTLSMYMVMGATLISRLLGFVRIAIIAAIYGAGGSADVLHLVFNIPNNLRKLMAEGALSVAFIPALSAHVGHSSTGNEAAAGIVRRLIALQLVIWVPILVLSLLFPDAIIKTILDFPDASRQQLAARLFQIMIHYSLLVSLSAVFMGVLNAHEKFVLPAVMPMLFSCAVIGAILLLHPLLGIYSMAVGVLVGGVAQLLFQIPASLRMGYSLLPSWNFRHPNFVPILRRWVPVLFSSGIFVINQQLALFFASGLAVGSSAALSNALVFWQLPFGILGVSIITVLFPAMSKQQANREILKFHISTGLQRILLLLVPAAIILILWARPIVALALQRGDFRFSDTLRTAQVLRGYSWGLWSVCAFNFIQRVYYARAQYRITLVIAIITTVIDVGLSIWLKETRLQVTGLAIANSIAFTIGFLIALWRLSRLVGGLDWGMLGKTVMRMVIPMGMLIGYLAVFNHFTLGLWEEGSTFANFMRLGAGGIGAGGILFFSYRLFRITTLLSIKKGSRQEKDDAVQ